jgi:hypothetical protein
MVLPHKLIHILKFLVSINLRNEDFNEFLNHNNYIINKFLKELNILMDIIN